MPPSAKTAPPDLLQRPEAARREPLTVNQLNELARELLEGQFGDVEVCGEISRITRAASGHWYLTLKDQRAQISCAMFRNDNQRVRFAPKEGMSVVLRGRLTLYVQRGNYQLVASAMEQSGKGELLEALERLKKKLAAEGLFESRRKRPLPALCKHLALITSERGAALHDVTRTVERRFPALRISLLPASVQGDQAAPEIIRAIALANRVARDQAPPLDAILLTRGGGDASDLWAFNDEQLARAVAASKLPVVSAVGHEIDVTIADFVADARAATPTAGAELLTPDREALLDRVDTLERRLAERLAATLAERRQSLRLMRARLARPDNWIRELIQRVDMGEMRMKEAVREQLERQRRELAQLGARLEKRNPLITLARQRGELKALSERLLAVWRARFERSRSRLDRAASLLRQSNPSAILERGYAIVFDKRGRPMRDAGEARADDPIRIRLARGALAATVTDSET